MAIWRSKIYYSRAARLGRVPPLVTGAPNMRDGFSQHVFHSNPTASVDELRGGKESGLARGMKTNVHGPSGFFAT